MRRPRLAIRYAMELTVAAALAVAAARTIHEHTPASAGLGAPVSVFKPGLSWTRVIDSAIWMFGLFEGSVVLAEWVLRRGPRPWGLGRWTWAMIVLERVVSTALDYPRVLVTLGAGRSIPMRSRHEAFLLGRLLGPAQSFAPFLLAAYIAFALARRNDPNPADSREWAGRFYGAVFVLWAILVRGLYLAF